MNDETSRVIFKLRNNAIHWHIKACKLKYCADLLFKAFLATKRLSPEKQSETTDSEIDDVATLLYGMAMENVLKTALLKDGIAKTEIDGTIAWNADGAGNHDLLGMSRSFKSVKLNVEQKKLMERLSAFVCWAGKYPTPLKQKRRKAFQGFVLLTQSRAASRTLPLPFDIEDRTLFDHIYKIYNDRI